MNDIWRLSAAELATLIRARKVSAREAALAALARLDAVNPALNAVVDHRPEEVLAQADATDALIATGGDAGILGGVPVTVKVNVDQAGFATTNGVALQRDLVAKTSSPVVDNLRKAGAVILGRTNTPAFSYRWFTTNLLHGDTYNPRDRAITPGGSSGGAGSAVAAGIGHIAHGTDIAGSIRYPAYACGVHGLRPTIGRVPAFNASSPERPIGPQITAVSGPLARTVHDLRLALAAMSRPDGRDPWWVPAPLEGPPPPRPIRVAVCADPFGDGVHPQVKAAVENAAAWLSDAGYAVEAVALPQAAEAAELWNLLVISDARRAMAAAIAEHGDLAVRTAYAGMNAAAPEEVSFDAYITALEARTTVLRNWQLFQERYPLALLPVSMQPPFEQGLDQQGGNVFAGIMQAQRPLTLVNLIGLPGMSVATGIEGGVAAGVQIVGQRFREDLCLDAAEVIEARAGVQLPVEPA